MKRLIHKGEKGEKLSLHTEPKREWLADWTKKNFPKISAMGEMITHHPSNPLGFNPVNVAQTAADFTGLPGMINAVKGNPMNLPEGEVTGAMLPAISVGKKLAGEAEHLASKIPQEWKDMPIKGVTVDDAEKGFHALNKNHWALNPKKLGVYEDTGMGSTSLKEKLALYGQAAGNRMMPLLMRTPLNIPIKKAAEKVMHISGGAPTVGVNTLKNIIKKVPQFGKYEGDMGAINPEQTKGSRDLVKLYLYGKDKGFQEAGKDVQGISLGERYDKLYPNAKRYLMESRVKHGEPIKEDIYSFSEKPTGVTESAVGAYDDIGGHMMQKQDVGGKPTLVTQDLWKFNPKDYSKRWSGTSSENVGNPYTRLLAEKQAGLLDKVGKPFYLVQNNPIIPYTDKITKPMNRFDLLKAPPEEITFKRQGGKLIYKKR